MRIGMVTTWACRCGIATYTEGLCNGLRQHDVMPIPLVPQRVSRPRTVQGYTATECWDKDDSGGVNASWLTDTVKQLQIDVLHIQHEFGLFRDSTTFLRTVKALAKLVPVVITLHTVPLATHFLGRSGWLAALRRHASAIVCHTPAGAASVLCAEGKALVLHIPHGSPVAQPGDPQRGLEILGLDRRPSTIGLSFGFIGSSKNISCTVLGFGEVLARRLVPRDACFFVVGDSGGDPQYVMRSLRPAFDFTGAAGINLHLLDRFVDDPDVPHLLAAADYAVLNTVTDNLSASGQVHQLCAYGVPAAVANKPIYVEGIVAGAIPFDLGELRGDHPSPSLLAALAALVNDAGLRAGVATSMRQYAEATVWPRLAGSYKQLYERVLAK